MTVPSAAGRPSPAPSFAPCGTIFDRRQGEDAAAAVEAKHRAEEDATRRSMAGATDHETVLRTIEDPVERILRTVGAFVFVQGQRRERSWGVANRRVVGRGTDWSAVERVVPRVFDHLTVETCFRDPALDRQVARWFAQNSPRYGHMPVAVAWPVPRRTWLGQTAVVCREYVDERPGPEVAGWRFPDGSTLRPFGSDNSQALISADGELHLGPERLAPSGSGRGHTTYQEGRLSPVALADMAESLGFTVEEERRRRGFETAPAPAPSYRMAS